MFAVQCGEYSTVFALQCIVHVLPYRFLVLAAPYGVDRKVRCLLYNTAFAVQLQQYGGYRTVWHFPYSTVFCVQYGDYRAVSPYSTAFTVQYVVYRTVRCLPYSTVITVQYGAFLRTVRYRHGEGHTTHGRLA